MGNQDLHKELDIIQSVINRMANNSFLVKGWAMSIIAALTIFSKDSLIQGLVNPSGFAPIFTLLVMLLILVSFWWLDAFFLRQEQLFRKVYDCAVSDPTASKRTRFDLNPQDAMALMNQKREDAMAMRSAAETEEERNNATYLLNKNTLKTEEQLMFSKTLYAFYIPLVFGILACLAIWGIGMLKS